MLKHLLIASTLLVAASTLTYADDLKINRLISLTGHGEVHAVPDIAFVTLGVSNFGKTAREALDANTKAMTNLMATLKAANIAPKDIATSNFSVGPRYDNGQNNGQPLKIVGYEVSNSVTTTVRKIDGLGEILDKAVSSGSNQINSISFSIANPQSAMDDARKLAVADAQRKAKLYETNAAFTLGNIVSLTENGGGLVEPQMQMRAKMMAADAAPVPIAQGEQVIMADVNITWEIK